MAAVFKIAEGVPCRACGAVLAPAGSNQFELCGNCWTSVRASSGICVDLRRTSTELAEMISEEDVNAWLAGKLTRDIKRLARDGIVGRCEAVSGWGYGNPGTQCALPAIRHRDGHKCCAKHFNATSPVYVSNEAVNHYEVFRGLIRHLASVDEKFASIIRDTAKEAS